MNWKQYIIISLVSFLMTILGYLLITDNFHYTTESITYIRVFDPIKMAKLDGKLHRLDQELKILIKTTRNVISVTITN